MEDEIFNRKINLWKEKLLDLSKRNRLLNYHRRKRGTYVLSQTMEEVFDTLVNHEDGKIELGVTEESSNSENLQDIRLTLTAIRKAINNNYEELGFNTGYIALGLLKWQDADRSVYQSPVLLIPVRVQQVNRNDPFVITLDSDEEIQINPVLIKKLSEDFGIHINVPSDGAALNDFFSAVQEAIKAEPQWQIEKNVSIDIFNFQNLVILKDLEKNRELIRSNPFIRSLFSNESKELFDHYNEDLDLKKVPSDAVLTVLDADSSQYEAIVRARRGDSFVLQGPPGTGKSQTITNIICDQMGRGKRVLFVSEKQAALDVVYNKLKNLKLQDFVLTLHSAKQSKSDIRSQLEKSLIQASHRQELKPGAMDTYTDLNQDIKFLDSYDDIVHESRQQWDTSFFDIQGKAIAFSEARYLDFDVPEPLLSLNKQQQNELFRKLEELAAFYSPATDRFTSNHWKYLKDIDTITAQTPREKLHDLAERYLEELAKHKHHQEKANKCFPVHLPPAQAEKFLSQMETLYQQQPASLHVCWYDLNLSKLEAECSAISVLLEEIARLENDIAKDETSIQEKFEAAFLQEEGVEEALKALKFEYNNFLKRLFSSKYKNLFKKNKSLTRNLQLTYDELLKNLELLSHRNSTAGQLEALKRELQNGLNQLADALGTSPLDAEEFEEAKVEILWLQQFKSLNEPQNAEPILQGSEIAKILNHEMSDWESILAVYQEYATETANLDKILQDMNQLFNFPSANQDEIAQIIEGLDFEGRADYISFRKMREDMIHHYGIEDFLKKIEDMAVSGREVEGIFGKHYYGALLDSDKLYRQISATSRKELDRRLQRFCKDDEHSIQLARDKIFCDLLNNIPDTNSWVNDGEVALLKKELKKKTRLMPTRKLIQNLPRVLPVLKPCIMMSPITVSNYFMSCKEWNDFDLVIFDEASQVKTEYAVAAISRGKQIIVAGDSKQMPPTDFFTAGPADDEEDDETADLESILDDLSVTIPTQSLDWHYRSRDESLIAFSNSKFYSNRLYTFPSTFISKKESIKFNYVPDGIWEPGQGNSIEAKRTAEFIFEHIRSHPTKSLGVVAFGAKQADLIEREVLLLRDKLPQYESFFQENKPVPFFIKNLENVQGDERDVIFLCVGYAKDPKGKLSMNFGPLTRTGGERRLNVAVSRARESMTVISSIKALDITVSDTQNENRILFRDFLDYAEKGPSALLGTTTNELEDNPQFDSPFEEDVYSFLVSHGYKLHTQVGASGYKIDMALLHPDIEGRYVLAIECDGATYHSSRTARDRDRLRQEILEDKGWNFYRIWSTVWFNDKEAESKRLLEAVENTIQNYNHEKETIRDKSEKDSGQSNLKDVIIQPFASAISRIPRYYFGQNPYDIFYTDMAKILTIMASQQIGVTKTGLMKFVNQEVFDKKRLTAKMTEAYEDGLDYAVKHHWINLAGDIIKGTTSENITL